MTERNEHLAEPFRSIVNAASPSVKAASLSAVDEARYAEQARKREQVANSFPAWMGLSPEARES